MEGHTIRDMRQSILADHRRNGRGEGVQVAVEVAEERRVEGRDSDLVLAWNAEVESGGSWDFGGVHCEFRSCCC